MKEERKGELYLASEALLWSLFPVVSVIGFAHLPALVSLAWVTFFATLFFAAVMTYKKKWHELTNPLTLKYGLLIALFIGVGYYAFYFIGLAQTTAGNAALLVLFEMFTTYMFFNIVRKESFPLSHTLGGICMILGALVVLGKNFTNPSWGDALILLATCSAPAGNLFVQKARKIASAETIMFMRSVITVPVILFLGYILGERISFVGVSSVLPYLLFSGIFLMGLSKIFWVEAVHRISVTKAMVLQSFTPLLTLLFVWLLLKEAPTVWQVWSLVPFFVGVLLLTDIIKIGRKANQ